MKKNENTKSVDFGTTRGKIFWEEILKKVCIFALNKKTEPKINTIYGKTNN